MPLSIQVFMEYYSRNKTSNWKLCGYKVLVNEIKNNTSFININIRYTSILMI